MEDNAPSTGFQNGRAIKRKAEFQQGEVMSRVNAIENDKTQFQGTHEAVHIVRRSESTELHRGGSDQNERSEHFITEKQNLTHFQELDKVIFLTRHDHGKKWMFLNNIHFLATLPRCVYGRARRMLGTAIEVIVDHLRGGSEQCRKQADEKNHRILQVEETRSMLVEQNEALRSKLLEIEFRRTSELERLADVKQNLVFGSYSDEYANPVSLNQALEAAQDAITRFSNQWFDCLIPKSGTFAVECDLYAKYYFARRKHICYAVKAAVNKGLFKHFERDDFGTGVNLYLDPELRQTKCLEYIRHSNLEATQRFATDDQFQKFLKKRAHYLQKLYRKHKNAVRVSRSDSLVYHFKTLEPDFEAAARSVWLLHKLAFAFEPPARILRVGRNAEYDQLSMKPVVTFADDEFFIPKVGFMIAPGFYLGKTTIKAEIYLAGNNK